MPFFLWAPSEGDFLLMHALTCFVANKIKIFASNFDLLFAVKTREWKRTLETSLKYRTDFARTNAIFVYRVVASNLHLLSSGGGLSGAESWLLDTELTSSSLELILSIPTEAKHVDDIHVHRLLFHHKLTLSVTKTKTTVWNGMKLITQRNKIL